ncbi:hypothetical protein ACFQAT_28320 [Undibacterium arcticum]|uniref:Uncharacterized protein n=1 Tax=Undibacterium arcticum TaxID=1762892 RepID=A0ABV7F9F7_9BURK
MTWFEKWWGSEKDEPISFWDVDTSIPPHWSAKPFRSLAKVIRTDKKLPWFQRPVGVVSLAIVESVIAAGIAKRLGWI